MTLACDPKQQSITAAFLQTLSVVQLDEETSCGISSNQQESAVNSSFLQTLSVVQLDEETRGGISSK